MIPIAKITATVAFLAMGSYAWVDSAPYMAAVKNYRATVSPRIDQIKKSIQADADLYMKCDGLVSESGELTRAARLCLIDALSKAESIAGTINLATLADRHLSNNKSDRKLKAAALRSIEIARAMLSEQKPWLYDKLEAVDTAYAQSFFIRILFEPNPHPITFQREAEMLNLVEYAIYMPSLNLSQQEWLVATLLQHDRRSN